MSAADLKDPRIGSLIAERYKILERLSAGGMGVVYRGERIELGRVVAVKFLHAAFAHSSDFVERFQREGLTMSRLDHPHCVSVIDFGVADTPFIVMDFVTGTTLKDLLDEGPVPPRRALPIMRQILAGLAHAHEKGIIHRDMKPANIMLTQATSTGDHVRILDFGLARLLDVDASLSANVVGTPSYMSPEQAGGKKTDARSDLYGAAIVLFELLTGEKPFYSDQALQVIRMHVEMPPPTLREKLPSGAFSQELEDVIARALAKSPDDRFQTADDFAQALAATPEAEIQPRAATPLPVSPRAATARAPTPLPVRAPTARVAPAPAPASAAPHRSSLVPALLVLAVLGAGGVFAWKHFSSAASQAAKDPKADAPLPTTIAGVKDVIAHGDREQAIRALHEMRRKNPKDAQVALLLGNLYFDKGWWSEAVPAYGEAIANDDSLKTNAELEQHLVDTLGDASTREHTRALYLKHIGAAGLPFLRAAAKSHKNAAVRAAATDLIAAIGATKPVK